MGLTRFGGAGFNLDDVSGIARKPSDEAGAEGRVTVFLRNACAVELEGEDAEAALRFVQSLLPAPGSLGPVGSRVAVEVSGGFKPEGRKHGG